MTDSGLSHALATVDPPLTDEDLRSMIGRLGALESEIGAVSFVRTAMVREIGRRQRPQTPPDDPELEQALSSAQSLLYLLRAAGLASPVLT